MPLVFSPLGWEGFWSIILYTRIGWNRPPVRPLYGGAKIGGPAQHPSVDEFRETIHRRYETIATAPRREMRFPVGPNSAKSLGYDANEVDALPPSVTESFCGVGNPLAMGELLPANRYLTSAAGVVWTASSPDA